MNLSSPALLALLGSWALWTSPDASRLQAERVELERQIADLPLRRPFESAPSVGFHSRWMPSADSEISVGIDLGQSWPLDTLFIVPAFPTAGWGYGFPVRYRVEASPDPAFKQPVTLLDRTGSDQPVPNGPLRVDAHGVSARWIRFTAIKLARQPNWEQGYMFCLGEILAFSGGRNVALGSRVDPTNTNRPNPPAWAPENLVDGMTSLGLPVLPDLNSNKTLNSGWHSLAAAEPDTEKWVQVDLGRELPVHEIRAIPANPVTFTNRPGFGFPVRFKMELALTPDFQSPTLVVDARETDYPNPGDNVLSWPVQNIPARYVRFTATRLFSRWNDYVFALAELEVFADGRNVALGAAVTCPEESPNSAFRPEYLVDGRSSSGPLFPLESWLGTLAHRAELEQRLERVKRQADIARIRQTERRITLSWLAGFSVLLGGLGLVWQVRRQRVREFQALREQIARDLHDEIGSSLGSISLLSELGKQDGDLGSLEEIHQLATEAADSMRGILWMIRDGKAPSLPQLEEAMRTQARLALRGADCQFTSQNPIPPVAVSLEFNRNLFLLFKEALHNAGRHAAASTVSVHLVWNARSLSLTVEDNGCGFDVDALFSGSGLINMRHRATALHARLEFYSAPGRGTRIALEVPLL